LPFVAVLASVHSFTFVAAAEDPQITPGPSPEVVQRQVAGGISTPILSTLHFPYTALPEQVYPYQALRGPQFGYNICNSTTQGNSSNCQTLIVNGPNDFCVWGSPTADGSIGDEEAKVVAYCTQNTHGARPIPFGAITGFQYTKTSAYVQIVGFIDNTAIGLSPTDSGGELDPHGADLQGNPLGGVVYSNATSDSTDGSLVQVYNWNLFVGSGLFCLKICDNTITSPDYCLNVYDLVGCTYNMPSNAQNGTYTSCDGDLQDVVGVYSVDGVTSTWSMPQTLLSPPPYTPRIPASSNCKTYQATDLFVAPSSTSGTAATATGTNGSGSGGSGSGTGSGSTATSTSSSSSALSSIGVPPAVYALCLGIMAGFALVL
jgi:hypothetical protein